MSAPAGPIQRLFEAEHGTELTGLKDEDFVPCRGRVPSGVTEIAIERTSCYGYCSMYTLILKSDGTAEWVGYGNVKRMGRHVGKIDPAVVEALATMALDAGFFNMKDRYYCAVTDNPSEYVSIVRDGVRKTVLHYAPEHNPFLPLYVLEETVYEVAERLVKWN
jgi:hypothetical protein